MFVFRLAEKGFVILALLFLSGAITDLANESNLNDPSAARDPISRFFSLVIQLGILLLFIVCRKKVFRIVIKEKLLWALLGLALASTFWSEVPATTLRGSVFLVQMTMFGVYLTARYGLKEQLQLLAWTFGIATLLSIICALMLPSYGVMGMGSIITAESTVHAGAWRGIYIHKNNLGRIMVLSSLVFFLLTTENHHRRWVAWVGFGLSVGLILLSTSKTSLTIFLTIITLLPIYKALRWNYTLAVPFFITVILVGGAIATLFFGNAESILSALGRDLTLTGRTEIWGIVLEKIGEHPWLGYGYKAFWLGWGGESEDIWRELKWEVPHAHNGFVDLSLDLGLLGVAIFALSFIVVYLRAIAWVRLIKTTEGLWPITYLTFLLLANLTESSLLRQNSLWILYVAVTLSMQNRSDNLAESSPFLQREEKEGAMKQVTQGP